MRKVWVFADIPHLIKLLRNNFLDYHILLPCGTEVSKQPLLKRKFPQKQQISKFFDLVDKWCEVMNSSFEKDFRKPWHSFYRTSTNPRRHEGRCGKHECNRKNFINAFSERHSCDVLETLFSRVRSTGNNVNPTPTQFKYRIRMLLFGNEHPLPSGTCVQDISAKKPYLTPQRLIKYTENNTEEENATSDNVKRENSEIVEEIEDEPEEEKI
ncbi:hypothetical protein PR048_008822, partial [Dryococelus australis]